MLPGAAVVGDAVAEGVRRFVFDGIPILSLHSNATNTL